MVVRRVCGCVVVQKAVRVLVLNVSCETRHADVGIGLGWVVELLRVSCETNRFACQARVVVMCLMRNVAC